MEYRIKGLQPEALFRFFEDISAIPRGSHNEKAISDYLVSFAKERGLWVNQDAANNVIIKKPASAGAENTAPVMLQGHLDMVCEKLAGVEHDFETEGLDLIVEDGVLRANGTTLGGDNGAAVALMMTVLDDDSLRHPPLECVFTVCEEVGLDGAKALDKSQLDSRTMINLDSEEEGVATVSCAGGMRYALVRPAQREEAHGFPVSLEISGLLGGHSGSDIHKERRNGVKLMARVLRHLTAGKDCRLMSFDGGSKDNAIPRECSASVLYLNREEAQKALEKAQELGKALAEEILPTEPSFVFTAAAGEEQDCQVLTPQAGQALVNAACLAPNGVRVRNPKQGNFVVTSLNLGLCAPPASGWSWCLLPAAAWSLCRRRRRRPWPCWRRPSASPRRSPAGIPAGPMRSTLPSGMCSVRVTRPSSAGTSPSKPSTRDWSAASSPRLCRAWTPSPWAPPSGAATPPTSTCRWIPSPGSTSF